MGTSGSLTYGDKGPIARRARAAAARFAPPLRRVFRAALGSGRPSVLDVAHACELVHIEWGGRRWAAALTGPNKYVVLDPRGRDPSDEGAGGGGLDDADSPPPHPRSKTTIASAIDDDVDAGADVLSVQRIERYAEHQIYYRLNEAMRNSSGIVGEPDVTLKVAPAAGDARGAYRARLLIGEHGGLREVIEEREFAEPPQDSQGCAHT
eukprot:gene13014-5761_t